MFVRLLTLLAACAPLLADAQDVAPVPMTDAQRTRIDAEVARFPPHVAGAGPQMYFLGFAGYGQERVFAEEIGLAARVVGEKFGSTPRSLLLVNDRRDLEKHPLATVAALQHALRAFGKVMNREEDVLFLVLSSHGSTDGMIAVTNTDLPPRGLAPEDLAALLRESGIRWRVVIVSACYSGTFVTPLADNHTIVLTAASKSRSSFGCSDDRDLTYFGEALFRDALPGAPNLRAAFEAARRAIRAREKEERVKPSQPQSYFGPLLETKLDELAKKGAGTGP